MERIIDLCEAGDQAGAAALYKSKGGQATTDLRQPLEALQEEAQTTAEAIYQDIDSGSKEASFTMVIMSFIGLLLLGLGSWWIARAITEPLQYIVAVCTRLRDGDFRRDGQELTRRDEFGQVADVVFAVRENLSKLMSHTHQSSIQLASASEELNANAGQSAETSNQVARSVTDAAGAKSVDALKDVFEKIQQLVEAATREASDMAAAVKVVAEDTDDLARQVETIDAQGAKVSDEMQTVSAATQEQSASAAEIASASTSLSRLATELQTSLGSFKF